MKDQTFYTYLGILWIFSGTFKVFCASYFKDVQKHWYLWLVWAATSYGLAAFYLMRAST